MISGAAARSLTWPAAGPRSALLRGRRELNILPTRPFQARGFLAIVMVAALAPAVAAHAQQAASAITGSLVERELPKDGGTRRITIYTPPGYAEAADRWVIYLSDGQGVPDFAATLEPLMLRGRLPRAMLVGLWNDPPVRAKEYLPGFAGGGALHGAYDRFVMSAVVPFAERELGAPARADRRVVAGVSDGASWALDAAARHRREIAHVIALSPGWSPVLPYVANSPSQTVFLGYGEREPQSGGLARAIGRQAQKDDARVCVRAEPGGHEMAAWRPLMADALAWLGGTLKCSGP